MYKKCMEILNEKARHDNEIELKNIDEFRKLKDKNQKMQLIYSFLMSHNDYKAYYTTATKNINFVMLSNLKYENTI